YPVLEASLPDRLAFPVQRSPRADVRRKRAHASPRIEGVVQVQLPVGCGDLLDLDRAVVGLWREGRRLDHVVQQPRRDLRETGDHLARVETVQLEGFLRRNR